MRTRRAAARDRLGAASWVRQLDALGATRRALAWDAPGYGASSRVAADSPVAADYAASLAAWLDALRIERCVLVGHSLGAIMAGAFARIAGERLAGLLLISPRAATAARPPTCGPGGATAALRCSRRSARKGSPPSAARTCCPRRRAARRASGCAGTWRASRPRATRRRRICSRTRISPPILPIAAAASRSRSAATMRSRRPPHASGSRGRRASGCR
ncbi:alpha/beta fold hydrolase [Burkholderia pseudomallei]